MSWFYTDNTKSYASFNLSSLHFNFSTRACWLSKMTTIQSCLWVLMMTLFSLFLYLSISLSLPAHRKCPTRINCARVGREPCERGSSHCGGCFEAMEENEEGNCVKVSRRNSYHHGMILKLDADFHALWTKTAKTHNMAWWDSSRTLG